MEVQVTSHVSDLNENLSMKYWIKIPKSARIIKTKVLLDCGATHMFINGEYVEELGLKKRKLLREIIVYNADGT